MRAYGFVLLTFFGVFALGCGKPAGPPMAPVEGTVMLDGAPLAIGQVFFAPDNAKGTTGAMGSSALSADGKFAIRSAGREGALVGFHKVWISNPDIAERPETGKGYKLPEKYRHQTTTDKMVEVKPDQINRVELVFESKP